MAVPTSVFLAVGDTFSGGVPASGDYLNFSDNVNYLIQQNGLLAPPPQDMNGSQTAGAAGRIQAARALPNRRISLELLVIGSNTGGSLTNSVWYNWRQIEYKLEQARAASGPLGHGTNVVLLVRYASDSSSAGYVAFDVLDGRLLPKSLGINSGHYYGATLELDCLPYGRMGAQTWPLADGLPTFTADIPNGVSSYLFLGYGVSSGPIPGHAGALAQIHVLDTSPNTSPGYAINRIRIGRRAVPGINGGMTTAQWTPIVNATTALGSATYVTGDTASVGSDRIEQAITDSGGPVWHDLARFNSLVAGITPLFEQGFYDVFLRVRESVASAQEVGAPTLALATGSANQFLIPDQYTVRLAGTNSGTIAEAGPSATATVPYPTAMRAGASGLLFYCDFETGDTTDVDVLSATNVGVGNQVVNIQSALAGQYGLRCNLNATFPKQEPGQAAAYPVEQQAVGHALGNTTLVTSDKGVQVSCWMQINGLSAPEIDGTLNWPIFLMGIQSGGIGWANQQLDTNNAYNPDFPMGGNIAALVGLNGYLQLAYWNSSGHMAFSSLTSVALNQHQPFFATLLVYASSGITPGNSYAATLRMDFGDGSTTYSTTVTGKFPATIHPAGGSSTTITHCEPDLATWGPQLPYGSAAVDMFLDDLFVLAYNGSSYSLPNQVVTCAFTDPNPAPAPYLYVQQNSNDWYKSSGTVSSGVTIKQNTASVLGSPPAMSVPLPSLFRGKVSVAGALFNPIYTTPVSTLMGGNLWHMVNLGTLALPPVSQFEGLNPAAGSGNGNFSWQLDVQGQPGSTGATTLGVDAIWLFPHDEPQLLAEYPGLGNGTLAEWVIDTRRDGRSGCVLRDAGDLATQLGSVTTIGAMNLAPGNNMLVILVEGQNGVHDVNMQYQLQVRYQALMKFINDDGSNY